MCGTAGQSDSLRLDECSKGTVFSTIRRAARPSGRARSGAGAGCSTNPARDWYFIAFGNAICSAITYRSLAGQGRSAGSGTVSCGTLRRSLLPLYYSRA